MKNFVSEFEIGGKKLTLEVGKVAHQTDAAVLARYGDTMVLVTVVARTLSEYPGYLPLHVEYVERLYAGGKIKGSRWVKREGRPSDDAVLSARLVDRSIRPLFPKDYQGEEVQVVTTVLSVDSENDPAILSSVAASAALGICDIPWQGPLGVVRVGMKDGSYFINPTDSELEYSDLDLVLAAAGKKIFMIEAQAKEITEEKLLGAVEFGMVEAQKIIDGIGKVVKLSGTKKRKPVSVSHAELKKTIEKKYGEKIDDLAQEAALKRIEDEEVDAVKVLVHGEFPELQKQEVIAAFDEVLRQRVRKLLLSGKRLDGRKPDQIREIEAEVGILPRTHGSAIFRRGQTEVLTVTTLGSPSLKQLIESPEGEETKRYMHHYSMPPYATGETGRFGWPSRREIGHGALVEKALLPVIPIDEKFPYTIRVVSETLSSNGSTSMASVCGSTLSLMDAGVPVSKPVAGVAMGLVVEEKKVVILSDILGIEDAAGDMDFKVAGTRDGITAVQLDVKTSDLTTEILGDALAQAKDGRLFILEKMRQILAEPRPKISVYAPKIAVLHVLPEKIGDVIGPGGRTIRKIIAETGAQVEIEDDGTVNISGVDEESVLRATSIIEGLTREVKVGEEFNGEVKRILPFGAFVEILPGKDGLVHVSDMGPGFVRDPADVVSLGQKVRVRVKEIDELGRINLSMFSKGELNEFPSARFERRKYRPKGPHFPTTRFLPPKRRF